MKLKIVSITAVVFAAILSLQAVEIKFSSNSPVKAGDLFKLKINLPENAGDIKVNFNGETKSLQAGLKYFIAADYAYKYAKIVNDKDTASGKGVTASSKYQSIFSVPFPQDGKSYTVWARAKDGNLCLRKIIDGKSKELKWNWAASKDFKWRSFGTYSNTQIGKEFALMTGAKTPFAVIDSVILAADKKYRPEGIVKAPDSFSWQTDASSVGIHEMPLTIIADGRQSVHKVKVEVLPGPSAPIGMAKKLTVSEKDYINVPLGKAAQDPALYPDFNIFNQAYENFICQTQMGIKFSGKASFIALHCKKYPNLPKTVDISVNKKLNGLAFLHTEYWQGERGRQIAFYNVTYRDGSKVNIPLIEEINIAGSMRSAETPDALSLFTANSGSIDFHISLFVWKNPHPEKVISNVAISNNLSRFFKEENRTVPLNVSDFSSQILLDLVGIKSNAAIDVLLQATSNKEKAGAVESMVTVNFSKVLGKINPYVFSTNETGIMNNDNPVFDDYLTKMDKIGCRMFRLHSGWSLQKIYPEGLKGPRLYEQLDAGIRKLLKGHPEREIMICINKIPKYIDPLKEADREQFAALCVDLLQHFRKKNIRVKYWEIYNEVYFKGVQQDRSLWKMYNLTAEKLKKIDPSLKIGGYAPCWPTLAGIRDFYGHCHKNVDFVSWHKYPTGSSKTPDEYIMASTNVFGKDAGNIRKAIQQITPGKKVELAITEYNINYNWRPHDPRQATYKGAVWMASTLNHLIKADVDIAMNWHSRSGGTFGMLSPSNEIRPVARLFYVCNRYVKSEYVWSNSNSRDIECLGFVQPGSHIGLMLINKDSASKKVKVSMLNMPPLPEVAFEGNAEIYSIGLGGWKKYGGNMNSVMQIPMQGHEVKLIVAKLPGK